ncbi:TPM domain-containing protein [Planococcus sp. APC 4015]|nr:TPM domain-containing protein [Planococcus sp. APC 4015]
MRSRWTAALATALVLMFAGAAAPAAATDPVDLGAGFVLDQDGVLSASDTTAVENRLSLLSDQTDIDLWVVYVDEFTDPANAEEWATQTAGANGLGPNQYLLAVAVDARQFYLSGYSEGPVSFEQLGTIEQQRVQPKLAADDWAGAAVAAADGLQDAVGGGSGGTSDSSSGGFGGIILVLVVAVAVGALIFVFVRSRRKKRPTVAGGAGAPAPEVEQVPTEELERRAASALVQTDDAVRTSEQELGFARAQFGDAATVEFEQALATAKENLNAAFTLKQQLDDATPDSDEQVRAWNTEILRLCDEANAGLDDKAAAFDELRKLEQNAPEALARVQGERARAASALDDADKHLQTLAATYAPEALATVADNPTQARQRIAFADEQLALAQTAIGAGDGGEAAVSIRAAEEAVGQAELLEQAIDKLGADLAQGETSATALLAELEQDIAAASALPDADGRIADVIAATRRQIDSARTHLTGAGKRPLVALQGLEAANQQIDSLVAGVRDAEAKTQRARQMVGQLILQAQAQVSTAEDFVTSRRGAIGAQARTRLAEAGAALVQAQQLQQSAPEQAMQYAQRANQLAEQAIQHAQNDVGSFSGGGMFGGSSGGGGDNMLGAVLGGIVINSLLGGGGRSSGSSGGLGGMFGGGGGGFGGGGRSSGSFGGGGTRSRRGGGRF